LLIAEAVSLTGTRLSAIALPWFVLTSTGSAVSTGLVVACEMTPYVAGKLCGGPLIDRLGPRRVSVVADWVSAGTLGAVPALHAAHALALPVLLVLVALTGAVRGPGDTAKRALVPDLADAAAVPLERAAGLAGTVERLADTVGPAVAGVIVGWLGAVTALAIDAGSFAVAAAAIGLTAPRRPRAPAPGQRYWPRLRAGMVFLARDRLLRSLAGMIAVTNLVDAAVVGVLLPVWARETGSGPAAIGLLVSACGATAMLGSLVAAAVGHRMPRRSAFLIGFVVAGAPRIAVLASDWPLGLVTTTWAVAGCGAGLLNPILQAIMIERIPRHLYGRVSAVSSSLASAGIALAGPLAAGLLGTAGLASALLVSALVYLAATVVPAIRPEWREMRSPRSPSEPAPASPGGDAGTEAG
jgi:MFS family permease